MANRWMNSAIILAVVAGRRNSVVGMRLAGLAIRRLVLVRMIEAAEGREGGREERDPNPGPDAGLVIKLENWWTIEDFS